MSEIDPKLSRAYREASRDEPPAALDAAILAAARAQVAKPQRRARAAWIRWMAPASAIATLVLGVSIALLVEQEQPEPARDLSIHPIKQPPQSAPPAAEAAKAKAADSAAPAQIMKREAPALSLPAQAPMRDTPTQVQAPAAAAPAPAAQAFPAESRERAAEPKLSAPKAAAEANVARDAAAAGAPAAAGRVAPLRQQTAQRSPETWLEEIVRLKRESRDQEAAEQLAEFRKAYPAYALPESLRDLR